MKNKDKIWGVFYKYSGHLVSTENYPMFVDRYLCIFTTRALALACSKVLRRDTGAETVVRVVKVNDRPFG